MCATRRRNTAERQHRLQCDLNAEFAIANERGFQTKNANIAGVTAILASSQDPAAQEALRVVQKAWLQLDRQNLAPSQPANQEQVGESHSHPQASRTPGGHPRQRPRGNEGNNYAALGSRSVGGRPRQPPRGNQAPPSPPPQHPAGSYNRRRPLENLPTDNLCEKINEGCDARSIIEAQEKSELRLMATAYWTIVIASRHSCANSACTSTRRASNRLVIHQVRRQASSSAVA
jgi:hypothetical protein